MTPLEIVHDVVKVAELIYNQAQLVESNKKRWASLAELIRHVLNTLVGLNELPQQRNFVDSLEALQRCIHETANFLNKMVEKSYAERFFNAGRYQAQIEEYRNEILRLIPVLNLGISAQLLVNKERDRRDELLDRQAFIFQEEEKLRKRQVEHFHEKRELEAIMQKQMEAFCEQLEKNWRNEKTPSPVKSPLPEEFLVKLYEITFEKKLMTSRTGDIYRATWQNQPVLVKFIEGVISEADRQQFIREAQIMSQLRNEHIVQFYGACFDVRRCCIVTGIIDKTLSQVLNELSWDERLAMTQDLISGLYYLHQKGVIHNDIHPDNIGVTKRRHAKWLDLSWVKSKLSSIASAGIAHEISLWQAPEIWGERQKVSKESDVYSIGWLLWSLYAGQLPSMSRSQRLTQASVAAIQQNALNTIAEHCPEKYRRLIEACWSIDPKDRPTLTTILDVLSQPLITRPSSPSGEEYYEQGRKAEQAGDLTTALSDYTRSAAKGYYKSFNSLGTFALGKGGQRKDPARATEYFKRGVEAGHAPAMFNLGKMYEKGDIDSGAIDLNKAVFWYEKARDADRGEPRYDDTVKRLTAMLRQSGLRK